ncbi:MAG: hypothetical protein WD772_12825 [Pseudohongiellaceae bacterium]
MMKQLIPLICLIYAGLVAAADTCSPVYPSYWQDPDSQFADQWKGQVISDKPPADWTEPVFRLSGDFPRTSQDESADQPWRNGSFDSLFNPNTSEPDRSKLANDYAWAVMNYIQEGNIGNADIDDDWSVCNNQVRSWYHIPFQTYSVLTGREFMHGLTRESRLNFSLNGPNGNFTAVGSVWAVAMYNATAAYTLGTVWQPDGKAIVPTESLQFEEGAVVGKLLFNTLSPAQLPNLTNVPAWTANISDPNFCSCSSGTPGARCTMPQESQQCPRTPSSNRLPLLQFDVAVKDSRAGNTQWVFATFVADGQRKANEPVPWNRISLLGLMWGNDTPPTGILARNYPEDPRENGFREAVIFWDTVDMLNAAGGATQSSWPGHLGCNSRLNGPADNQNATCLSCHATSSVVDTNNTTVPLVAQFKSTITEQCVLPSNGDPNSGIDASGANATVQNGISFATMDHLFLYNTPTGTPFNSFVGNVNVLGNVPDYGPGESGNWISLDYSLQLSISILQWKQWMANKEKEVHTLDAEVPSR